MTDPSPSALTDADFIVVGAGLVGVASALALARRGHRVRVLDRQEPGRGASYGNAGHLATEQVFPIADASILRSLPGMLMDPMGPLRLDWKYLPRALPWLTRLVLNLRPAPFRASVAGLRALNERSLAAWQRLLASVDSAHLLKADGSLLVYEKPESRRALDTLESRMRAQQVPVERWDREAIRLAAPQLSNDLQGGLFFPGTGHVLDPWRVVNTLVDAARREGVRFEQETVQSARLISTGVVVTTDAGDREASQVLIACGAHSAALTAQLSGKRVPLDTERGYHLMLPREHDRLPFAVTSLERRFIMTPMETGLRLAGTVEFAGLVAPPNMERAWQLHRLSRGLFKTDLDAGDASPWMGFRPSLPDSLPVIDRLEHGRVLLAFGHHHLGLTQAAITAELIADLAGPAEGHPSTEPPDLPPRAPYRLSRFD
ncbi:NAD(P)/FAD-dependent oxidoreductase [Salinicola acroporae]|uniref:FAD-dependent oxidoreductase n=1 Tax=Salinicola acroporae TaxID=1541440 RepID=A0ABT6I1P7_9GAMM|nr:FAD-dependent oxidoreductase [Salinicola acroporae]MDH4571597.1 FAD-dependent oxidoreductase [Salinicola acroporae]